MIEAVDPSNTHLSDTVDYTIVGVSAALRALVEQGQSDAQIGAMARCSSETVRRWRMVFEVKRKPKRGIHTPAPIREWLTRALFRKAAKKAYARHGRRWPAYDPAEDVSYDPFWPRRD